MKTSRKFILFGVILVSLLVCPMFLYLKRNGTSIKPIPEAISKLQGGRTSRPIKLENKESAKVLSQPTVGPVMTYEETMRKMFSQRIDFYGVVVDEQGTPISEVEIGYRIFSDFDSPSTELVVGPRTDSEGRFSIVNKRGAEIFVRISHPEYIRLENKETWNYAELSDANGQIITAEKPAHFIMKRIKH